MIRIVLGALLIITGIVGIILPVVPGWIFLISGMTIISPKYGKAMGDIIYKIYNKYVLPILKKFRIGK